MEDSFARTRVFVVGGCSQGLWFAAQLAALLLCMSKYLSPVIDANTCLFRFGGRMGKQRFLGLGLPEELMGGEAAAASDHVLWDCHISWTR